MPLLFNYLIQFYPKLDSEKLAKQTVFKKVFKGKPFSDSKYTNLCFECTRLIEEYLIIKKREEDEFYRNSELRDIYFKKLEGEKYSNNFSLYKNVVDKLERLIELDHKISNADQEFEKSVFYGKKLKHINFKKLNERVIIYYRSLAALENFYQIKKAILKTERTNLIGYLGLKNTPEPQTEYFENFYFKIFNLLEEMIAMQDFKAYLRAKQLVFENVEVLPTEIRDDIFQLLKNFLVRAQPKNAALYSHELANLFSEIIDKELLTLFKTLDFLNTIISLATVDLKRAIEFQAKYIKSVPNVDIPDVEHLSMAHILYHQNKLRESFALVSTHKFSRHMTEIMARVHELRCGYEIFKVETDFREFYKDRLINIGKQLKRSKLPSSKRASVGNLVLKRIVNREINNDFDKNERQKILIQIDNLKPLTSRDWLRKKVLLKD